MVKVGAPTANDDAANKSYVDTKVTNTMSSAATKQELDNYLKKDGTDSMKGSLDMDSNQIYNLPNPKGPKQPTPLAFTDLKYVARDGSSTMTNNLNMDNKKIINLRPPTSDTDATNKKYVDDSIPDTSSFIKKDGSITMTNNLNLGNKKIVGLATPSSNTDAANKKYVDDNTAAPDLSDYLEKDGTVAMTGDLNVGNNKIVGLATPVSNTDAATKKYVDDNTGSPDLSDYLEKDGTVAMTGNLNLNNNKIVGLATPTSNTDAATKKYVDDNTGSSDLSDYLEKDGTVAMTGNLNLNNNKIVGLATPTSNTDAATKKYVDDNTAAPDLSDYLEKDGTVTMTGNLNVGNNKIINLGKPTQDNDAVNKNYADKLVHHTTVQPSHYNNQFAYLMSSGSQWTDEIDTGTSFVIKRIGDLAPNKGNFHDYNHKVIFMGINKNSQGGYKYKMGINFYRLTANTDYTLCLEILNSEYALWHKSQISVDKGTSTGLTIGNVSIRKLSHRYIQTNGQPQFMYYHRIIVNFRKLSTGNKFFLHILVNIPETGTDLAAYPNQFLGVYLIAYGIVGTFSNIDPDKVYDFHTAYDIKPTEVTYNVDINANQHSIKGIKLDPNDKSSAATMGQIEAMTKYTINNLYREIFEEIYDFTNAANYKLSTTSSGIVFSKLSSSSGVTSRDMRIPDKTIDNIKKEGLNISNYDISFSPPVRITKYTLCLIFYHWRNRNFSLTKKNLIMRNNLLNLRYSSKGNNVILIVNTQRDTLKLPNDFNGKKIVLWLTENFNANITKVKISNYSAILSLQSVRYSNLQKFTFNTEDGVISKIMFSPNFYDTDSDQYHKVLLQEKLNGSYVL